MEETGKTTELMSQEEIDELLDIITFGFNSCDNQDCKYYENRLYTNVEDFPAICQECIDKNIILKWLQKFLARLYYKIAQINNRIKYRKYKKFK